MMFKPWIWKMTVLILEFIYMNLNLTLLTAPTEHICNSAKNQEEAEGAESSGVRRQEFCPPP